jgi:hypothetical protein
VQPRSFDLKASYYRRRELRGSENSLGCLIAHAVGRVHTQQ